MTLVAPVNKRKIMKKLLLINLCLFTLNTAYAVNLSSTKTGQVLLFPYYTVNADYNSVIKLINTTNQSKALRVRFREAANNREVFTFNLYLGPNDVWTGHLNKGDSSQQFNTVISSIDKSCTYPFIDITGTTFYMDKYTNAFADGYGININRMYEGYIEVIEMGVLKGGSAQATLINQSQPNGNCSVLRDAWDINSANSYWLNNPNTDLLPPTGGLTGTTTLIDSLNGNEISQEAVALNDFSNTILHYNIDNDSPSLADSKPISTVIDSAGQQHLFNWATGIEAVSSVLMKSSLANEYKLDDTPTISHDWIVTFPTKQYHTDPVYAVTTPPLKPFIANSINGISCEQYDINGVYNGEEQLAPNIPRTSTLCFASNNLSLFKNTNNTTLPTGVFSSNFPAAILNNGAIVGDHIVTSYSLGWVDLIMQQSLVNTQRGLNLSGLPSIGFSTQGFFLNNVNSNILGNYTSSINNNSTTTITPIVKTPPNNISGQGSVKPMQIAKDNIGQVLIYPFYTVKNNLRTQISVVNTTNQVKALRIIFREGKNARNVLSFNIYLGAYDVWSSTLLSAVSSIPGHVGEASAKVILTDSSCTVPTINFQEFLPYGYELGYDQQGRDLERSQEGFIEIFEMGVVTGADATAIMHDNLGLPNNCQQISDNWRPDGQWQQNPTINMLEPDGLGGLSGSVTLVDRIKGKVMQYNATAILNFSTSLLHSSPGATAPNLSTGNNYTTLINSQSGSVQTTWHSTIDAVSALFMQTQIINEFDVGPNNQSEWVVTYPTKAFYVDSHVSGNTPLLPFTQALVADIGACENHRFKAYNNEQAINTPPIVIAPPDPLPPNYSEFPEDCRSVNVSDVNNGIDNDTILASILPSNDFNTDPLYTSINDLPFTEGWMLKDFDNGITNQTKLVGFGPDGSVHEIYGKPVLGLVVNNSFHATGDAIGTFANYTTLKMNRGIRKIKVFDELFANGFE